MRPFSACFECLSANTGVVPSGVSTDDGYSSNQGVKTVKAIDGIDWVSISGAKGKNTSSILNKDVTLFRTELFNSNGGVYSLTMMARE